MGIKEDNSGALIIQFTLISHKVQSENKNNRVQQNGKVSDEPLLHCFNNVT